MILTIAWRNIWRSRTRSSVVIGAVVIGIWALIFLMGWMVGMTNNFVDNIIQTQTSHLQIHHPAFHKDRNTQFFIPNSEALLEQLRTNTAVQGVAPRALANGMASSPRASRGVMIRGIDPEGEAKVTDLATKVKEGDYFDKNQKNPIIIGQKLAEKLKVGVRKKITLQFQNAEGDFTAQAYRVVGIYKSGNSQLDERIVYVRNQDLEQELKTGGNCHEIALLVHDFDKVDTLGTQLQGELKDLVVETYQQVSPSLKLYETQIQGSSYVVTAIIMIALIFGIINTMLMAVLERVRELGMLMAVGMNKFRVFGMIVVETLILSLVGVPLGILLGHGTMVWLSKTGLNLSKYSESLEQYGMSSIVYPSIDPNYYITIAVAISITAIIASIYPAFKAIRLKPVEAIRKI